MSRLLKPLPEPRGNSPQASEFHLEPVFHAGGRLRPVGLNAAQRQQLGDHYAHRIRRRPLDLDAHIRRIFLLQGLQRRHSMLGAVADLFIALDGKGAALRQDLMSRLSISLSRQQMDTLDAWVMQGARAGDTPASLASLLQTPATADSHLLRPTGNPAGGHSDTLGEAREYLLHGQVEKARDLLEKALLAQPADTAVATELLTIYRHSRDLERLQSMAQGLRDRGSSTPESAKWRETLAFLRTAGEA